jgi:hypothetical protein
LDSPILPISGNHLQKVIHTTWTELERYFELNTETGRAYIYVGCEPNYSLPELQRIAQAVYHFEEAIDTTAFDLFDDEDDGDLQERNWLHNTPLSHLARPSIFNVIGSTRSVEELHGLMRRSLSPGERNPNPWLFELERLLPGPIWSVVYRGWPNFESPVDAMDKINWTVSFITTSMNCPDLGRLTRFPPTKEGLKSFLTEGRSWLRRND